MEQDNYFNYATLLAGLVVGIKYDLCQMYLGYVNSKTYEKRIEIINFISKYKDYFDFDSPNILVELLYEMCPNINQRLDELATTSLFSYILWKLNIGEKPSYDKIIIAKKTIDYCKNSNFLDNLMSLSGARTKDLLLDTAQ